MEALLYLKYLLSNTIAPVFRIFLIDAKLEAGDIEDERYSSL